MNLSLPGELMRHELTMEYRPLSELKPCEYNPRINCNVDECVASIQMFGFLMPICAERDGTIVAGHTRYLAAQKIGLKEVPCVDADGMTQDDIDWYRIIDNKTAELSVWDLPMLYEEYEELGEEDTEDLEQFGFDLGVGDIYEIDDQVQPKEFDTDDFADDEFEYQCPECGFRFNLAS